MVLKKNNILVCKWYFVLLRFYNQFFYIPRIKMLHRFFQQICYKMDIEIYKSVIKSTTSYLNALKRFVTLAQLASKEAAVVTLAYGKKQSTVICIIKLANGCLCLGHLLIENIVATFLIVRIFCFVSKTGHFYSIKAKNSRKLDFIQ